MASRPVSCDTTIQRFRNRTWGQHSQQYSPELKRVTRRAAPPGPMPHASLSSRTHDVAPRRKISRFSFSRGARITTQTAVVTAVRQIRQHNTDTDTDTSPPAARGHKPSTPTHAAAQPTQILPRRSGSRSLAPTMSALNCWEAA